MKNTNLIFTFLAFLVFFSFSGIALPSEESIKKEFTSIQKLENFAKACNSAQVKRLLKNDTNFEINFGGITLTPVQLAINTHIEKNNEENLAKHEECVKTVTAIISDERYDFREQRLRYFTDIIYAISRNHDVKDESKALERYSFLLNKMLDALDEKDGFDILYQMKIKGGLNFPRTALQSAAKSGDAALCVLINRYSDLVNNLEQREDSTRYTPLLFAVRNQNRATISGLLFYGADYFASYDGYNGSDPIVSIGIAKQLGRFDLEDLIRGYLNGHTTFKGCSNLGAEYSYVKKRDIIEK